MDFSEFFMRESYKRVSGLGDRLERVKGVINWGRFRPLVASVYNDGVQGGRHHTDEVVVIKCMLLQAWYGLSDPELEFQASDRLSFRNFLDFPESVPDFSTVWRARERLKNAGVDKLIWKELQKQLDSKGFTIKKGVIQDATFIESDVGRKREALEKKAKKEGREIRYTQKQESHIDTDATYSIKNGQVHHGYKNHIKMDVEHQLIREYEVTTASTHDSQINLANKNDEIMYRDKGYQGSPLPANVIDKTMKRAARGHPLTEKQKGYNTKISHVRIIIERAFSVTKRTMHNTRTLVKRLHRVSIKEMFKNVAYNLYQLITLNKNLA